MPYKDPEKQREHERKYRAEHYDEVRAMSRSYYLTHKPELLEYAKTYRAKHREKLNAEIKVYRERHIEERRAHDAAYYRTHKKQHYEHASKYQLRRKFGIDSDIYNQLWLEQDGLCYICHRHEKDNRLLAVDHDHETKEIRHLLCRACNIAVGTHEDIAPLVGPDAIKNYLAEFSTTR